MQCIAINCNNFELFACILLNAGHSRIAVQAFTDSRKLKIKNGEAINTDHRVT